MVDFNKKIFNTDKLTISISYSAPVNLTDVASTNWMFAGIYKITNNISGKCYIGQAVDIRSRLMEHLNASNTGKNVIYKAIRKYGADNFTCQVLLIINTFGKTKQEIKLELNAHEVFYIDLYDSYNSGYNMTPGGDSGRLGMKHTKDTILKIKASHKNYKPKCAYDASKITYGYDLLTKTLLECETIAEMSHKTTVDYRSIGHICKNTNYKNGGRFISKKRWLFSFDKDDLIERVNWYFSGEYKKSLHLRMSKHWQERRDSNNG